MTVINRLTKLITLKLTTSLFVEHEERRTGPSVGLSDFGSGVEVDKDDDGEEEDPEDGERHWGKFNRNNFG